MNGKQGVEKLNPLCVLIYPKTAARGLNEHGMKGTFSWIIGFLQETVARGPSSGNAGILGQIYARALRSAAYQESVVV